MRGISQKGAHVVIARTDERLKSYATTERSNAELLNGWLKDTLQTRKYKKNGLYHPSDHDQVTAEEIDVLEMVLAEFRRSEVTIQVNLDLNIYEERSSFHYLNNFQKPVKPQLSLSFDLSNPINEFSDELLKKDVLKGKITQVSLVAINSILFTKKTGMKGARPADIQDKKGFASKFWEMVLKIPNVLEKTSVARPVVIKALASIAFVLHKSEDLANLATLFSEIPKFDFSHENPLWRYYTLSEAEREQYHLTDLKNYLPPEDGTIRTLGVYKEDPDGKGGRMHWSITHNSVFPLIADTIRWRLHLPARKHQKRSRKVKVEGLL
jgi:DNA-sulfur modification-associated